MKELRLADTYRMPAVLWMRLATESGLEIQADTIRQFGAWAIQNGIMVLLRCKQRRNSAVWDTPELTIAGWAPAYGYTPVELLLAKYTGNLHWLCHLEWQAVWTAKPSTVAAVAPLLGNANPGETVVDKAKSLSLKVPSKRSQRKKLEPIEKLINRCGRPVMDELEKCLQRESIAPIAFLQKLSVRMVVMTAYICSMFCCLRSRLGTKHLSGNQIRSKE